MPELPEAEITRRKLAPIIGKTVSGFWTNWPRGLRILKTGRAIDKDIRGRRVQAIMRHGKVIFLDLGKKILAFHQRMSGRLLIVVNTERGQNASRRSSRKRLQLGIRRIASAEGQRARAAGASEPRFSEEYSVPSTHVHVKLRFKDGGELWFYDPRKFGVVWYGKPEEIKKEPYHKTLGLDGLSITPKDFKARLRKHKGMIKPLLLRQDVVAGIGNIIADETLWASRVHPKRRVETMKDADLNRLFRAMKSVLRRGIRAQGTTLRDWGHPDGESGKFQKYFRIYGRGGEKCYRCKSHIKRIVVGGRGAWICPKCQRL